MSQPPNSTMDAFDLIKEYVLESLRVLNMCDEELAKHGYHQDGYVRSRIQNLISQGIPQL